MPPPTARRLSAQAASDARVFIQFASGMPTPTTMSATHATAQRSGQRPLVSDPPRGASMRMRASFARSSCSMRAIVASVSAASGASVGYASRCEKSRLAALSRSAISGRAAVARARSNSCSIRRSTASMSEADSVGPPAIGSFVSSVPPMDSLPALIRRHRLHVREVRRRGHLPRRGRRGGRNAASSSPRSTPRLREDGSSRCRAESRGCQKSVRS